MKMKGGELQKMESFVTSKNSGGKSGGGFMETFCSWTFGQI